MSFTESQIILRRVTEKELDFGLAIRLHAGLISASQWHLIAVNEDMKKLAKYPYAAKNDAENAAAFSARLTKIVDEINELCEKIKTYGVEVS